jgi:geranylgeranyl reductase family protein
VPSEYNVIVIGGGPAGATAAYRLAREGLRTLLVEKEKLPRYKACGGALTEKVFRSMDVDIAPVVEDSITSIVLSHRHRTLSELRFEKPTISLVMRDKFDNYLTEQSANQGVVVHDGEPVRQVSFGADRARVKTDSGEYQAEIVVGADGANGITARSASLGQPRGTGAALELELSVGAAQLDSWRHRVLVDWGAIPFGYAWIFPKADHLSVGIGTFVRGPLYPKFVLRGGEPRANLRARLAEWMACEPSLRSHRVLVERGHLVPLGGPSMRLDAPRVVLAGDSGGLVEPLLAEGIYYALRSGQIAAEVIVNALVREDLDLSQYTSRIQDEFTPAFQRAAGLARLAYRFPRACLTSLSLIPPLRNSFGQSMENPALPGLWTFVEAFGNWLDSR